ncbi:MAG TPA: alpha/beta hydrolase [Gemmatimonadales bacterium]|nr:alpha/beta hydrolase [Gemmatimonadales bacterium]
MRPLTPTPAMLVMALLLPCVGRGRTPTPPAGEHRVAHVVVAPGVDLEVLDWGGTGEPLIFLAGIGDTGHSFDEFAPAFTDRWHVYAITRRGYGASTHTAAGYDVPTFAADIEAVIDTLGLSTVSLVGHSFAGDEITRIAAEWPGRVSHLVYLDAAYDRVGQLDVLQRAQFPDDPPMRTADSASPQAVGSYLAALNGFRLNDEELHQWFAFDDEGKLIGKQTSDTIWSRTILRTVDHPPFDRVTTPALLVYAVPESAADLLPWYPHADTTWQRQARHAFDIWGAYRRADREHIPDLFAAAQVIDLPGANHYVFISNRDQVLDAMRRFLIAG